MPGADKGKAKGKNKTSAMLRDLVFMEEDEEEPQSYGAVRVKLQGNTKSPEQVHNLRQRRAPPLLSVVLEEAVRKNATQKNSKKAIQKKNSNTRKKKSESEQSPYLRELHEYKRRHFDGMNEQDKYGLTKAIEYVEEEESAKMDYDKYLEEQVDYLRESKDEKKFFVLTIFGQFINDELKEEITKHLESLDDWIKNTLSKSLEEMKHYYEVNCISKQASIVQKLTAQGRDGTIMAEKYKHLTTPFYYDMQSMSGVVYDALDDEGKSIWVKFRAYVENKDEQKKGNKEAIYHVFTDDIDIILHINTGSWRQLFSDGHAFMDTKEQPKTIETCGNRNTTMLPRDDHGNYLCPACTEKIGFEGEQGTFAKQPGVRVSVDHVDPVKHAFITYKNDGLCEQLTMTCYECNLIKSNMPVQKFIYKIHEDHRPVYMFREDDFDQEKYLKGNNPEKRNDYYVNNIVRSILKGGIKTLPEMLKSAAQITRTYKNVTELKNKEIQKMLEISKFLDSVPALLSLEEATISPEYLLGMVETFIFTTMDYYRISKGISFDQMTYVNIEDILDSFIKKFTELGSDLLNYVMHYTTLIPRHHIYNYMLWKNIMVSFVFQYLGIDDDKPIPINMFKQFCHRIYKTYSDYELYEFWRQQASGSLVAEPGRIFVGPERFVPSPEESENKRGKRPKASGKGKTKKKNKKNKHIKRR